MVLISIYAWILILTNRQVVLMGLTTSALAFLHTFWLVYIITYQFVQPIRLWKWCNHKLNNVTIFLLYLLWLVQCTIQYSFWPIGRYSSLGINQSSIFFHTSGWNIVTCRGILFSQHVYTVSDLFFSMYVLKTKFICQ